MEQELKYSKEKLIDHENCNMLLLSSKCKTADDLEALSQSHTALKKKYDCQNILLKHYEEEREECLISFNIFYSII